MFLRRLIRHVTCLGQGALVWLFVGLVVTLDFVAVCPEAHAFLHGETEHSEEHHAGPTSDDGCAVTLFQHGVTTPPALPQIETPRFTWIPASHFSLVTFCYSTARQVLPPARGPPASA